MMSKIRNNFQEDSLRDFMDAYILQTKDPSAHASFHGERGFHNMKMAMFDLFSGGSDTTANTLNWTFYHLAKRPQVQAKIQAELDAVIGQNRLPSMEDKSNLPYFEATIQEIQRYGCDIISVDVSMPIHPMYFIEDI